MSHHTYPSVSDDIRCDCAVIGGGLSGIFTAHLLARKGMSVALFEADSIASGKTCRSTAKVTLAHSTAYSFIARHVSEEASRKYAAANLAGMRLFTSLIDEYFGKGFGERDFYLYSKYGSHRLADEFRAMSMGGIECSAVHDTPLPFSVKSAVLLPNQRQIEPVSFTRKVCEAGKFRVYENSPVIFVDHRTLYSHGHRITAPRIVITTNYPMSVPLFASPVKLCRKTSCAVKMSGIGGRFPEIMSYGEDVEVGLRREGDDSVIVSGMGERGGAHSYTIEHLVEQVREFAPDSAVTEIWTNNDTYTHDMIPYAGEVYPGVYLACGYSAWGMTNSAAAAVILAEEVAGGKLWYADVFAPRGMKRGVGMIGNPNFAEHLSTAVGGYAKRILGTVKATAEDVGIGEGKIIMSGGRKCGAYRDEDGVMHFVSIRCPHLGCELGWNSVEKTWDCPCHGSRFSYTGECLSNPAQKGIGLEV